MSSAAAWPAIPACSFAVSCRFRSCSRWAACAENRNGPDWRSWPSNTCENDVAGLAFPPEFANPAGELKPEMFAVARLSFDLGERLAIPETAVIELIKVYADALARVAEAERARQEAAQLRDQIRDLILNGIRAAWLPADRKDGLMEASVRAPSWNADGGAGLA